MEAVRKIWPRWKFPPESERPSRNRIRGKDSNSNAWVPNRGLREGCLSSPPLFNIYNQAVMRVAAKKRKIEAEEKGQVAAVVVKWVPGSAFPSEKTWEKTNSKQSKSFATNHYSPMTQQWLETRDRSKSPKDKRSDEPF